MSIKEIRRSGHPASLFSAFLHFDISFMVWGILGALGVSIATDLHLSAAEKGMMTAVPILGGSFFRIVLGILADRYGPKRVGSISMFVVLIPLACGAFLVKEYNTVLMVGSLLGVAGASFAVSLPLASRWYPPERQGLVMGIAGAGNSGTVISTFFAPRLATIVGWHTVMGLAMIPVVIVGLTFLILAKDAPGVREQRTSVSATFKAYGKLLSTRDAWLLCFIYSITFGGFVGMSNFMPIFFSDQFSLDKISAGNFAAICVLAGSGFRPVGGYLSDKVGGARLLMALFTVLAVFFFTTSFLPPVMITTILLFVVMSCLGMGNGAVFQIVPQRFRQEIGLITGLVGAAGGVGGFFLPNLLGIVKQNTGNYGPAFIIVASLVVAAFMTITIARFRWERTWLPVPTRKTVTVHAASAPPPSKEGIEIMEA